MGMTTSSNNQSGSSIVRFLRCFRKKKNVKHTFHTLISIIGGMADTISVFNEKAKPKIQAAKTKILEQNLGFCNNWTNGLPCIYAVIIFAQSVEVHFLILN
jgi:hypothetical protein